MRLSTEIIKPVHKSFKKSQEQLEEETHRQAERHQLDKKEKARRIRTPHHPPEDGVLK